VESVTALGCAVLKLAGGKWWAILTAGTGLVVSMVGKDMVGKMLATAAVGAKGVASTTFELVIGKALFITAVDVEGVICAVLEVAVCRASIIARVRAESVENRLLIESTADLAAVVTAVVNGSGAPVEICALLDLSTTPGSTSGARSAAVACKFSNGMWLAV
jgi:hypothetical protein